MFIWNSAKVKNWPVHSHQLWSDCPFPVAFPLLVSLMQKKVQIILSNVIMGESEWTSEKKTAKLKPRVWINSDYYLDCHLEWLEAGLLNKDESKTSTPGQAVVCRLHAGPSTPWRQNLQTWGPRTRFGFLQPHQSNWSLFHHSEELGGCEGVARVSRLFSLAAPQKPPMTYFHSLLAAPSTSWLLRHAQRS